MRKLLFLSILPLFLLGACDPYEYTVDASMAVVYSSNRLVVGYHEQPFFSYTDQGDNTLKGLDIALAREVARRMGVRIRFTEVPTDSTVIALNDVSIDLYWSGLELPVSSNTRSRSMLYSDPYYTQGTTKYATGFKLDGVALRREVNRVLAGMKTDGTLARIIAENSPD